MRPLLLFLFLSFTIFCGYGQTTLIPDANFEQALIDLGIDSDGTINGQVLNDDIETVTFLDVSNKNISDLTGIDSFIALTSLDCSDNNLTELNVYELDMLTTLTCRDNNLTKLIFNESLTQLVARNNSLKILDFRLNTGMTYIECQNNDLYSVDFRNGNNAALGIVIATGNSNLICINVDDAVTANAGGGVYSGWAKDVGATYSSFCDTYVPDDNFEQALINLGYDAGPLNDFVPTMNITALTSLDVSGESIADMTGIEAFSSLLFLVCHTNQITTLDLSHNDMLATLSVGDNLLENLYVKNSPNLFSILCDNNSIAEIDVSQNTDLTTLNISYNPIEKLEISQNTLLEILICRGTQLTQLDLKPHTVLTRLLAIDNPNLSCIQVTDPVAADAGTGIYINWNKDATAIYSEFCPEFYTYVPDDNFEQALIDAGHDTGVLNDYVLTEDIRTVTLLGLNNEGISDLTGIEAFEDLLLLNCNNNMLTSLDVSQNTKLAQLRCFNNQLTSLDVTNNAQLVDLRCGQNQISTLDVSQNTNLTSLRVQSNGLSTLDITNNTLLETLYIYDNSFLIIDVSNNTALRNLWCYQNDLYELELDQNVALESLRCYDNDLRALDLAQNPMLTDMDATLNTPLSCIQVTDEVAANAGTGIYATWLKDVAASYAQDCGYIPETYVPDDAFELALINLGYDTGALNDFVPTNNISGVFTLDVNGEGISDLTGIEDFSTLSTLLCANNTISTLDVSANTNLTFLSCYSNGMTSLNLSPSIHTLYCYNNNLSSLDVGPLSLDQLRAYDNSLSSLDLANSPDLINLQVGFNNLSSIDISSNLKLEVLSLQLNNLTSLDIRYHNLLTDLTVASNDLTSLNVKNKPNLTILNATTNPNLTCIQVDDVAAAVANPTWFKDVGASFNLDCGFDVIVSPKVYLQGPLLGTVSGLMSETLRSNGYLPTTSPYTDAISCDASVFNTTGNDAIVDWVYVELRDATDNTIVIEGQSAFLQADGDIVARDGSSDLSFTASGNPYYVVIKHRNHLGIMTNVVSSLTGLPTALDFTDANNPITHGTHAQTTFGMPTNTLAMWSGNANGDDEIVFLNTGAESVNIKQTVLDVSAVESPFGASVFYKPQGYYDSDVNMDGEVIFLNAGNELLYIKDNILAHPSNQIFNSVFYKILEQLP